MPCAAGSPRLGEKPIESLFSGQCRQPRRGGTGGEELRRLRWSSPPGRVEQVPPPAQPWGCKGRSPLHKKTKNLPLPRRGRGVGGWGKEIKLKAGAAGDKESKPPIAFFTAAGIASAAWGQAPHCVFHSGRDSQCRAGSAPLGTCSAGSVSAAGGLQSFLHFLQSPPTVMRFLSFRNNAHSCFRFLLILGIAINPPFLPKI